MKTSLKLLAASCLFSCLTIAQPYGEKQYVIQASEISTGIVTTINPQGFLTANYKPLNTPGSYNFSIYKTGIQGDFFGNPDEFSKLYFINVPNSGCSGGMSQATTCYGVSVIETSGPSGQAYALAGVTASGCFFATLDASGTPFSQRFYRFPGTISPSAPTKPLIVESLTNPNTYIITGSFRDNRMYAMCVNLVGGVLWSYEYPLSGNPTYITPVSVFESPFSPGDIKIFGNVSNAGINNIFMLSLDNGGNFLSGNQYGAGPNNFIIGDAAISTDTSSQSWFAPAGSAPGYVFTGKYTNSLLANYNLLLLKVTDAGNISLVTIAKLENVAGNVITTPYTGTKIMSRLSSTWGYLYYTMTNTTYGITVKMFDRLGGYPAGLIDQFNYKLSGVEYGRAMTMLDNGGATDIGIHVFGTDPTTNNNFMIQAYLNLWNNCNEACCAGAPWVQGPFSANNPISSSPIAGLNSCVLFSLGTSNTPRPIVPICSTNSIAWGSNARTANQTEPLANIKQEFITDNSGQTFVKQTVLKKPVPEASGVDALSIHPNPSNGKIKIGYSANENAGVELKLLSSTGQLVCSKVSRVINGSDNSSELNFADMNVESGMYILQLIIDGITQQQKVIYQK